MNDVPSSQAGGRQLVKTPGKRRLAERVASKLLRFHRVPVISRIVEGCLFGTLLLDGALILWLAIGDLGYADAVYDWLGAALLFLIAGANFAAIVLGLYGIYGTSWAAVAAFIAQALVFALAGYILFIDAFKSPKTNIDVMLIVGAIGFVASVWCLVLLRRALTQLRPFIKTAAVIGLVVPLAGSLQFYLQNYYAPHRSEPLVDVSTELKPQSESNSRIHLSATVTVHNRGSARASVGGSLLRITAYPSVAPPQKPEVTGHEQQKTDTVCELGSNASEKWCQIATGLALSGRNPQSEFRAESTTGLEAQVLYAGIFMPYGSFLAAGETDTFQRVVDIDPATVRLVRSSVSAVFFTQRNVKDARSCWKSRASDQADYAAFADEVDTPLHFPDVDAPPDISPRDAPNILCVDYEFAPQNIIDKWIGNQGVYRIEVILNDPLISNYEYPELSNSYAIIDKNGKAIADPEGRISKIMQQRYPISGYGELPAEYAPGGPIKTDGKG
ncbi:hypothetical protein [Mycobacterium senriense]|uniref:hypothetical protein n=1 Tax=Mycobacterium senriense TaxID=2775496 RepID=UPI001C80D7EB|nr:hypothetical protein [Mycobacterium senriense]